MWPQGDFDLSSCKCFLTLLHCWSSLEVWPFTSNVSKFAQHILSAQILFSLKLDMYLTELNNENCKVSLLLKINWSTRNSVSRDCDTIGEQNDLQQRDGVDGTNTSDDRAEESGTGGLSTCDRDLLPASQGTLPVKWQRTTCHAWLASKFPIIWTGIRPRNSRDSSNRIKTMLPGFN